MLENPKLNCLSILIREYLEPKINKLESRNINETKDLKLISSEYEKLKSK